MLANRHVMAAYARLRPWSGPPPPTSAPIGRATATLTRALAMARRGARAARRSARRPGGPRPRPLSGHRADSGHSASRASSPSTTSSTTTCRSSSRAPSAPTGAGPTTAPRATPTWWSPSSHFSKERIVDVLGIEPERVEVVHFGIDHDALHARGRVRRGRAAARPRAAASASSFYPANLWPHKNHERLLEALALLGDRRAGPGADGPGLRPPGRAACAAPRAGRGRAACSISATCSQTSCRRSTGARDGARLPQPLRGLRRAAARGDGLRLPGRGLRSRPRCRRSAATRRYSSTPTRRSRSPTRSIALSGERGRARAAARGGAGARANLLLARLGRAARAIYARVSRNLTSRAALVAKQ